MKNTTRTPPTFGVGAFRHEYFPEEATAQFRFVGAPFVVSVSVERSLSGYAADYWVSGVSWSDFHNEFEKSPRLLLKVQMGIKKKSDGEELTKAVISSWELQIVDLALLASNEGEMLRLQDQSADSQISNFHSIEHLRGQDECGNLDDPSSGNPLTVRTARQYELLKSMGNTRPQRTILDYETRVKKLNLLPTALDKRLHIARQLDLIPKKENFVSSFFTNGNDW
jgi:hypothetical protein